MRVTYVVHAAAILVAATGCNFASGGHHHGGGGGCATTTLLSDDFSSGTLGNWNTIRGSPTISMMVGNPPPSASLADSAAMQDAPALASVCGLTIAADVKRDSGLAGIKVVIPGVAKIALLQVFDTVSYYVLCNGTGCNYATEPHASDHSWHTYRFVIDTATFDGAWYKDGAQMYTAAGVGQYASLRVNLFALPADSAGLGPSLAYFDNVVATSP